MLMINLHEIGTEGAAVDFVVVAEAYDKYDLTIAQSH